MTSFVPNPVISYANTGIQQPGYVVHSTSTDVQGSQPAALYDPTQSFVNQSKQYDALQAYTIAQHYQQAAHDLSSATVSNISWDTNHVRQAFQNQATQTLALAQQAAQSSNLSIPAKTPGSKSFPDTSNHVKDQLQRLQQLSRIGDVGASSLSPGLSTLDRQVLNQTTQVVNTLTPLIGSKRPPPSDSTTSTQDLTKKFRTDPLNGPVNPLTQNPSVAKERFNALVDGVQGAADLQYAYRNATSGANLERVGQQFQQGISRVDTLGQQAQQQISQVLGRNPLGEYTPVGEVEGEVLGESGVEAATTVGEGVVTGAVEEGAAVIASEAVAGSLAVASVELLPVVAAAVGIYEVGKAGLAIADSFTGGAASKWVDNAEQAAWTGVKEGVTVFATETAKTVEAGISDVSTMANQIGSVFKNAFSWL